MLFPSSDVRPETRVHALERVKATLLTRGVVLRPAARDALQAGGWKVPRMVRSGMSGGLEFHLLADGMRLAVSCQVDGPAAGAGAPAIDLDDSGGFFLAHGDAGQAIGQVEFLPEPSYYARRTSSNKPMASVAQQSFSRLAVGVFGACALACDPTTACGFCAIRDARETDHPAKADADILETVQAVQDSELGPALDNVMLGGGSPASPDRGARRFAALARSIADMVPWRIMVMMTPPAVDDDLRRLRDAGVQTLSVNMEFGSPEALARFTPGKASLIGQARYRSCLEAAAEIFGPGQVQSLLVTGLEDDSHTLAAVQWLAERRIVPVLSPFRPLPGTPMAHHPAPDPGQALGVYRAARAVARRHGMFLGPRCPECQCNTMSLPWDVD